MNAELYKENIVKLHEVPKTIVSDHGAQFVTKLWKSFHVSLGIKLLHSTAYHPLTDGQTEKVNQVLEDMLKACTLKYLDAWMNL